MKLLFLLTLLLHFAIILDMKINYIVKKKDHGKTLKEILKKELFVSAELIKRIKLVPCITINQKKERWINTKIAENDLITIDLDQLEKEENNTNFCDKFELLNVPLSILYEDDYLLIVNKPSNMPVHPSCDNYTNTLSNIVAYYLQKQNIYRIHIVTRLDKDTSGICIFAKHEYVQELFVKKKNKISLQKEYLCLVNGILAKNHDIIEKPIARKEGTIILREVNSSGSYAKTEYQVLTRNFEKNYTSLNIILHTGRTHQIRVHMASIGHVLLGDELYGNEFQIINPHQYINRQALHCKKVSFYHPITDHYITLEAPIPDDIKKVL